ncbi:MAG: hypothetical protein H6722_06500 [Sandaracinus sp.]|nr:hypothetical protein [Sandaracinus sp.]
MWAKGPDVHPRAWTPRSWTFGAVLVAMLACSPAADPEADARRAYGAAEAAWRRGEPQAYAAWAELTEETSAGRDAHERLERAASRYREGVERLERGEGGAREALAEGARIAPIDPALYLRLARACRDRGIDLRAAEYYSKFLAAVPEGPDARAAREELRALDPTLAGVFDPPAPNAALVPAPPDLPASDPWLAALAGLLVGIVLGAGGLVAGVRWRRRGMPFEQLLATSPEVHPAAAYLVGSLRHELLKHRIGATRDALDPSARGGDAERLEFLHRRLYGEPSLAAAWRGHVDAFERALGPRVDLGRDRAFRKAARAIVALGRLEPRVARRDPAVLTELRRHHDVLVAFDARLAELVRDLVRTRVDEALVREVVDAVRGEHSAGSVALDALDVCAPDGVVLEVFRVDLVLILKNVIRNAVLAVGRAEPPRHVAVRVELEMEPTGDETVRLRVLDSSPEELDPEVLFDRRVDRGLGLVAAAVRRYGGAIDVEPEREAPFTKAVVVSFFRVAE